MQIKVNDGNSEESLIEVTSNYFDVTYSLLDYKEQAQGYKDSKSKVKRKRNIKEDEESETDHEEKR